MPRSIPGHGLVITSQPPVPVGDRLAVFVDDLGHDAGQRLGATAGLGGIAPGSGVIMMPPVSVCHQVSTIGQRSPPIFSVIPHPGLGIDPFADGAQQAQARQVVLVDPLVAPLDERADGRRRGVEDVDLVRLDDLPEAVLRRASRARLRT